MAWEWNGQQDKALKQVIAWAKDDKSKQQVFRLFGYAGTGKTTLAQEIANAVGGVVLFAAYTGKAALVLRSKGCEASSTIHSLIYRAEEDGNGAMRFKLNNSSAVRDARLVIIDEGSMVDGALGADLLSFGRKVLVLGDPFQLKPVHGEGFFTAPGVEPDVMLTDVERQAKENPIIYLSKTIREGQGIRCGTYGETKVIRQRDVNRADVMAADQILVGRNKTRRSYNSRMRQLRGYSGDIPCTGERLVCLRNNSEKGLLNGSLWDTAEARLIVQGDARGVEIVVDSADFADLGQVESTVPIEFFLGTEDTLTWQDLRGVDQFTYGDTLTVHKSQGSQWPFVYLFDESWAFRDQRWQHLYTGITRAEMRATVVV